jgi:hypothetical protein
MDGSYIAEYVSTRTADTVARSLARIEASRRDIVATRKRRWHTVRGGLDVRLASRASARASPALRESARTSKGSGGLQHHAQALCLRGRSISRGSPEFDIAFAALTFVLDAECFGLWQEEMGPRKEQGK